MSISGNGPAASIRAAIPVSTQTVPPSTFIMRELVSRKLGALTSSHPIQVAPECCAVTPPT
jgi:hypothetical protein